MNHLRPSDSGNSQPLTARPGRRAQVADHQDRRGRGVHQGGCGSVQQPGPPALPAEPHQQPERRNRRAAEAVAGAADKCGWLPD